MYGKFIKRLNELLIKDVSTDINVCVMLDNQSLKISDRKEGLSFIRKQTSRA